MISACCSVFHSPSSAGFADRRTCDAADLDTPAHALARRSRLSRRGPTLTSIVPRAFAALAMALLMALDARAASAQGASADPTFDLLRAAHAADSLRAITLRQRTALARAGQAIAARSDTILRLRRELASLRARADSTHVVPGAPVVAPAVIAPAPSVVPTAPSAGAAPTRSPPAPASAPPSKPTTIAPTISGMLQLWLLAGDAGYRNTYRLRRVELKGTGAIAPRVTWTVMVDVAKALSVSTTTSAGTTQSSVAQGSRALQDAVIGVRLHPRAWLDVGQQKLPFGIEGFQSSGTLPTVERALFASDRARGGGFGDVRDVGATVRGRLGTALDYHVGVFNGSGESQNDVDANLAKSGAVHLAYRAGSRLLVGASGVAAGRGAGDAPVRDRAGVELRAQIGALLVQSEAVTGRDGPLTRRGLYTHAGVRVRPALDLHARFDAWDPDAAREADATSATERDYLLGFTWIPLGPSLKAQADAVRRTYSAGLASARTQLLLNLQTNW